MRVTPEEFEKLTATLLRRAGLRAGNLRVHRRANVTGADGTYEIDVLAEFEALGAGFLVLIECKHHHAPIKREVIQILNDRIRSIGAHKGMLFSTAAFQSGAIEYARAHGIALVRVTDARPEFVTRSSEVPVRDAVFGWIPQCFGEDVTYHLLERKPVEELRRDLNWTE